MLVSVRARENHPSSIRRLDLYYAEKGRVSGFNFTASDPAYAGDRSRFFAAAMQAILTEVRSRLVAHEDFCVWFYDDATRQFVEQEVSRLAAEDATLERFTGELMKRMRVLDANSLQTP